MGCVEMVDRNGRWRRVACALAGLTLWAVAAATASADDAARSISAYGEVPIGFEANHGQSSDDVRFLSRGSGYGLYLRQRDLVLAVGSPTRPSVLRMIPQGASARSRIEASRRLDGTVNYLVGGDGRSARRGVPTFGRVTYRQLYRGIDMVVRGHQGAVEYDFVLAPGSLPRTISLRLRGAQRLAVSASGDLLITTAAGVIRQSPPFAYQRIDGRRREVPARFRLRGHRIGFRVGPYDRERPLVIDPVIEYSTFLGGAGGYDQATGLALGSDGSAYVGGLTFAADFPVSRGAADARGHDQTPCAPAQDPGFEPPPSDACRSDGFVTKLSPDGTRIEFSTFLGGTMSDRIQDVEVGRDGAVYLAGGTNSRDFPLTAGALDADSAGHRRTMGAGLSILAEAFLTKLSPDGSRLLYSTFLGGADAEEAMAVSAGPRGTAFVTGHTFSRDYPTTATAFDRSLNHDAGAASGCSDMFVTKVGRSGASMPYSTLLGGSRLDFAWELDVDHRGAAYVLGESTADDAPTTPGAFQERGHLNSGPENADCSAPLEQFHDADPLVVKVGRGGSRLAYSTYLGGSRHEHGLGIAVHRGRAHVVGHTNSADFPTTTGAHDTEPKSTDTLADAFATKLDRRGRSLVYSTLLGGTGDDWAFGVAVDKTGVAHLTGMTTSPDFPTTEDALDATYVGPGPPFYDAFVTLLSGDGSGLPYSSLFGGSAPDVGLAIAQDDRGGTYVAGLTFSADLTVGTAAFSPVFKGPVGYSDAFVAKFSLGR